MPQHADVDVSVRHGLAELVHLNALDPRLEHVVVHAVDQRDVAAIGLDGLLAFQVDRETLLRIWLRLTLQNQVVERITRVGLALARRSCGCRTCRRNCCSDPGSHSTSG